MEAPIAKTPKSTPARLLRAKRYYQRHRQEILLKLKLRQKRHNKKSSGDDCNQEKVTSDKWLETRSYENPPYLKPDIRLDKPPLSMQYYDGYRAKKEEEIQDVGWIGCVLGLIAARPGKLVEKHRAKK